LGKKRQHIKVPLISIVDDDRSVVEAMVSLIQSVGYKAKGFPSAEDFLKSRQLRNTACLILDVRMPSMGGFELQRRLAAGNYRIPIIFITSYDSDDVHIQAFQAGAVGFRNSYEYPIVKKHFYIIFNTKINKYQPINCYLP
jgi:FixJ family two-component response regulator